MSVHPQSTNKSADNYNVSILYTVDDISTVNCVSVAFYYSLTTETNFIKSNFILFMNGIASTVVMAACNHTVEIYILSWFLV